MFDLTPVVSVRGEVVTSNISDIKDVALAWISNINTSLKSDEDFSEAANDIKACKEAEAKLEQAKADIVAQMAQVETVLGTVDEIKAELAKTRLFLTKLVKDREQEIKEAALKDVRDQWIAKVEYVNNRLGFMKITGVVPDFQGAVKGCKTLKSYKERLNKELFSSYEMLSSLADSFEKKRNYVLSQQEDYGFLFSDMAELVKMEQKSLEEIVVKRIAEYEANIKKNETAVSTDDQKNKDVAEALTSTPTSEVKVDVQTVRATNEDMLTDDGVFIPSDLVGTARYVLKLASPILGKNEDFQRLQALFS